MTQENLWKKRFLIPLWVVQIIFLLVELVPLAAALALFNARKDDDGVEYDGTYDENRVTTAAIGVAAAYIALCSVTILFDITEMVLYAQKKLKPVLVLVFSSITAAIWLVVLIVNIVRLATSGVAVLGFLIPIVITATCKAKLAYAIFIFHRHRKGLRAGIAYSPAQTDGSAYTAYEAGDPNLSRDAFATPSEYKPAATATGEYFQPANAPAHPLYGNGPHEVQVHQGVPRYA